MKIISVLILFLLFQKCQQKKEPNPAIGSWSNCLRDGGYREFRIDPDFMVMLTTEYEDGIGLYTNKIENNSLIITGINVSMLYGADTLLIIPKSENSILLKNRFAELELTKLNIEIGRVDSMNLESRKNEILRKFQERVELSKCPDLRTEEEKNRVIEMGVVEDDFEDLIDIPYNAQLDSNEEK